MENHADFTVRELASILARVNSPAFGFTVDCANLAFDLDDPLRLAEILAPARLDDALQELPHHPHAATGWPWRTARWATATSTWSAIAATAGEAQPGDQPEHRDPLAVRPVPARHPATRPIGRGIRRRRATAWPGTWRKSWSKAPLDAVARQPCRTAPRRGNAKPRTSATSIGWAERIGALSDIYWQD